MWPSGTCPGGRRNSLGNPHSLGNPRRCCPATATPSQWRPLAHPTDADPILPQIRQDFAAIGGQSGHISGDPTRMVPTPTDPHTRQRNRECSDPPPIRTTSSRSNTVPACEATVTYSSFCRDLVTFTQKAPSCVANLDPEQAQSPYRQGTFVTSPHNSPDGRKTVELNSENPHQSLQFGQVFRTQPINSHPVRNRQTL